MLFLSNPLFAKKNSTLRILEIDRLKRRVVNDDNYIEYIDTGTVLVNFRGQKLPNYIRICGSVSEVKPYIKSVLKCRNC